MAGITGKAGFLPRLEAIMRKLKLLLPLVLIASPSLCREPHRLGVTAGFPQMGAIAYQYTPVDYLTLEGYLGTMIINTTAGMRVIVSRTGTGLSPRAYAGIAIVDQWYGDNSESPIGTSAYLWSGAGLGYNFPCGVTIFTDLGSINRGNPDKGLGFQNSMVISGGLLFSL